LIVTLLDPQRLRWEQANECEREMVPALQKILLETIHVPDVINY
jgi:hypothetical protein